MSLAVASAEWAAVGCRRPSAAVVGRKLPPATMKWLKHKEFPFWNKKSKTAFDVFLLKSEEVQKGKFETPQLEARLIRDETYFLGRHCNVLEECRWPVLVE